MGIHVSIYKTTHGDCTNGGASSYSKGLTITNAAGPFVPCADYPGAVLVCEEPTQGSKILRIYPDNNRAGWSMFGGNYAATSDSRFGALADRLLGQKFFGAVAIFDRVE